MDYTLSRTINDVHAEVEFSMGKPLIQLFNKTRNICRYFKRQNSDPIFNIAVRDILTFSNVSKCPIQAGHYQMNDFTLDDKNIPRFTPSADFLIRFRFFYFNYSEVVFYVKMNVFGTIKNLKPMRFKGGLNPSMFG